MQRRLRAYLSVAALASALSAGAVSAQTSGAQQGMPQQGGAPAAAQQQPAMPAPIQPTDAQLQKFVGASQKVASVADEYRPRVQSAKDDSARQELLKEADAKMVQMVQADGLSVEEFNCIGQAVQQQPQLKEKAVKMLDKKG